MDKRYQDALILNVDDSDGSRYVKTRILTRAGFKVIEAISGNEALERARDEQPSVVLLDVKLPDINGFEVCRRLKADVQTQSVMVLQTSASYLAVADRIRALEGGADNYLFEPIEPEELVANVKALLRLASVERELREADRRKNIFLATLAHELRNPLSPIRHSVELMEKLDPDTTPELANARKTIERQIGHLVRLVDDLLDVSRISEGKIILHRKAVRLRDFVDAAVETVSPLLQDRKHRLEVSLPNDPIWIEGDQVRLAQVLGNLLHNAAKFMMPGGLVRVEAAREDGGIALSVTDTGIGIDPAEAHNIFKLFKQAGHAEDRVQDGLGIGLSLVKTLVELHGGRVSVDSPGIGRGSTFTVWLPVSKLVAHAPVHEEAQPDTAHKRRVLVVDDNRDAANVLAMLLQFDGHSVETRFTGEEGIACAEGFHPEVVFLDIGLPDLSGHEVAQRIRLLPGMNKALLVALSGYGQDSDKKRSAEAGFDHHIVKPIDASRVAQLMRHPQA